MILQKIRSRLKAKGERLKETGSGFQVQGSAQPLA
jgi:hypothetical protein